ncbi:hypothetical protein KGQ19_08740 [Catenulispora sp. NL8]|uniref:Uncharacterized protein n=1 Tax=Catenulispora pinistramenti TaxID=2705254 RepID=A0ABS5KLR5_9ACTN|nr:hypothetical protein [Catenulispora pinistramenti]MBS2546954.1 hypothetical protein [Catenulispora pinistramenti]
MTPLDRDAPQGSDARPKTRPKQALIRPDQQTALDHLARELHDARSVKGERITANTVLRVAIDGLVEHGNQLHGDNEVQLLASWREFLGIAAPLGTLEPGLSDLVNGLDGARNRVSDQITVGMLIRIAVAGLARHRSALHGTTESELLASWLEFLDKREAAADH